jgi:hypothetical protein
VTLPDVRSITWDRPQRVGVKPECRYIARLALMGHELWRCRHRHEKDREARRCGFEAWRLLCRWLAADDVAG